MMTPRRALASLALGALTAGSAGIAGCVDGGEGGGGTHADSPHNANPPPQGIGPSAGVGAAPRDMPGGGRGSSTPRGK